MQKTVDLDRLVYAGSRKLAGFCLRLWGAEVVIRWNGRKPLMPLGMRSLICGLVGHDWRYSMSISGEWMWEIEWWGVPGVGAVCLRCGLLCGRAP